MVNGQTEEPKALYNFIYKNDMIIKSYYSQLFGGFLTEVLRKEGSNDANEFSFGGSGSIPPDLLKGSMTYKSNKMLVDEEVSTINPHDIITIDTLSCLSNLSKNINDAKNNEIIKFSGNLIFLDKQLLNILFSNMDKFTPFMEKQSFKPLPNSRKNANPQKAILDIMKGLFDSIQIEKFAYFRDENNVLLGSIRDEYLIESVASFQFRLGFQGLNNITVIGIKEEGTNDDSLKPLKMKNFVEPIFQFVNELIMEPDTIKITPIAIYREISL